MNYPRITQNFYKDQKDLSFALTLFLHPPIVVVVDEQDVDCDRGVDEEGHGKEMQNLAENNLCIRKASGKSRVSTLI